MLSRFTFVFTILLFLVTFLAHAQSSGITLGYLTCNDYLKLNDNDRIKWLTGAMDGIMAESTYIEKDPKGPWLGRCIDGLSIEQIKAMFEKALNENPEGWHAPAAIIFRDKMHVFYINHRIF
jgi:hypothetical protein